MIAWLWETCGQRGLELVVDRQGGRTRYAPLLAALLPRARLEVVRERPGRCEYRLTAPPEGGRGRRVSARRMRIVFAERAELRSLPVALASCLAKYARETCMDAFNVYFGALQSGLRPTAGYTTDGRRWLAEAVAALHEAGLDPDVLVRAR